MINSLSKVNYEILSKLKIHFLNNAKQISSTLPDLSIDISELDVTGEHEKFIGPSIFFLYQKGFIILNNRRITITPQGIEELEPFYMKNKNQIIIIVLSGFLGILGTIIGVILT
nr:hypothetical protein [Bacteroidota bacterium]